MDPLFRVTNIKVTPKTFCSVVKPGSTQLVAAVENKAYPYGSRVIVSGGAEAKVFFDPINECALAGGTDITLRYDGKQSRTILLHGGTLSFKVDEEFKPDKTMNIETAGGRVSALQGKFVVSQSQVGVEGSSDVTITVACDNGKASFKGVDFQVAELDHEDTLTLASTLDKGFVKVINTKGGFNVGIRDADGNPRDVPTKPGQALKIWRKPLSTGRSAAVTILITSPEGKLLTTPEGTLDKNAKISYRAEIR
jgi:hypothetical protein